MSFSTISKPQRGHGSPALIKEIDDAGLIDLVANRQHMVTTRYIERLRPWNERGEFMAISGDLVLRADGNQYRRANSGSIGSAHGLTRAADAGGECAQVGSRLLGETSKHVARLVLHIAQRRRFQRLGDALWQTDSVHQPNTKAAENCRSDTRGMVHRQKCRDARAH